MNRRMLLLALATLAVAPGVTTALDTSSGVYPGSWALDKPWPITGAYAVPARLDYWETPTPEGTSWGYDAFIANALTAHCSFVPGDAAPSGELRDRTGGAIDADVTSCKLTVPPADGIFAHTAFVEFDTAGRCLPQEGGVEACQDEAGSDALGATTEFGRFFDPTASLGAASVGDGVIHGTGAWWWQTAFYFGTVRPRLTPDESTLVYEAPDSWLVDTQHGHLDCYQGRAYFVPNGPQYWPLIGSCSATHETAGSQAWVNSSATFDVSFGPNILGDQAVSYLVACGSMLVATNGASVDPGATAALVPQPIGSPPDSIGVHWGAVPYASAAADRQLKPACGVS